jgi:hypothetical protein
MSLLREIQEAAIDSKVELTVLLRKCMVLAARLGNPEFKQWVENELNGYENINSLPDYRRIRVHSKGHFSGPFQSGLRNADIPMSCIPKEFVERLSYSYLTQPIAALESLIKDNKDKSSFQEPWNPDLVAHVGCNIYENMSCLEAWKVIPYPAIVAVLDSVRNKILSFALEIENEFPGAGEATANSQPMSQERVNQIFNTYILGNVQNVATGSTDVKQNVLNKTIDTKIFDDLIDIINRSIEDRRMISELIEVVNEMKNTKGHSGFKEHYLRFMSILADHIQVFGPIIAPYLPALASML